MAVIKPNEYSSFYGNNIIQADCTRLTKGSEEINQSKDNIQSRFESFQQCEDYVMENWEGDTAERFKGFRQRMDLAIIKAMQASGYLSTQVDDFARKSLLIDEEASQKAAGKK